MYKYLHETIQFSVSCSCATPYEHFAKFLNREGLSLKYVLNVPVWFSDAVFVNLPTTLYKRPCSIHALNRPILF